MHVAFDSGHNNAPLWFRVGRFLRFHERHQVSDSFFHHPRALHHLRQEHFARAEQVADHAHPSHQRTLNHLQRPLVLATRFLSISIDVIGDALNQRMFEALLYRLLPPRFVGNRCFAFRLYAFRKLDQPFCCIIAAVQQHVFDAFPQLGFDLFVNCQLPGIHNRHVETGPDRVIQKSGVHCLAHSVVAAKRKRNVADPTADTHARQVMFDPARCFNEIDRVIAVLLQAGRDRQDVRIENDVARGKMPLFDQQIVSARADIDFALKIVSLPSLIKSHHDSGRAVSSDRASMPQKFLLAVFQADGVHDGFSLHTLESGLDDGPLRTVDHDRDARDVRFAANQVQEANHRRFRIDHSFVHVHVEQVCAALHLLTRHSQRTFEIARQDQL